MEQAGACEPSQMLYRARSSESVRCDLLLEVLNGSRQQLDALLRRAQHLVGLPLLDPRMLERSEEHTSELQSRLHLVCRLLLEKKKKKIDNWQSQFIRTQIELLLSHALH